MNYGYFIQSGLSGDNFEDNVNTLKKLRPGSIVLVKRNFGTLDRLKDLIGKINHLYKINLGADPPYIALDQEGGNVVRVDEFNYLPSNYCLGQTGNENLAYYAGLMTGTELKGIGVRWNLAPVLDVLENTHNPVILERSFGNDMDIVAKLGGNYIRGIQATGVAATAKHFPGHGSVLEDSHVELPKDMRKMSSILNGAFPFRVAIREGVRTIMLSHVLYPSIDPDFPATLSSRTYSILRSEFNFDGVVITDSMNMKAVRDNFTAKEIATLSFQGGADIIESADIDLCLEIKDELEKILLPEINNKIRRIHDLLPEETVNFIPPREIMQEISFRCTNWRRRKILDPSKHFLIVILPDTQRTLVNNKSSNYQKAIDALMENMFSFNVLGFPDFTDFSDTGQQIILIGRNEDLSGRNEIINSKCRNNSCVYISTSIPRDTGAISENIGYISSFSAKTESILAAVYSIFGMM